jgi:glycolate oxidase
MYGNHGDMINGLEVILPNGEICKLGSCAVSDYWFTRGPIPDFIGLFTSSFGTMGIVTKLSIKLFPKPKMRDIVLGLFEDPKMIPDLISKITSSEIAEDILLAIQDKPAWMKGYVFSIIYITGDSEDDLESKKKILKRIYRKVMGRYMKIPDGLKDFFLEKPIFYATTADFRKGGGFEYVGGMMPLEKIPEVILRGSKISYKHGIIPTMGCRVIGKGHNILFFITYAFNRADPADIQNARNALEETNKVVLELGGIPWKAEVAAQQLILQKMNPNYKKLLTSIQNTLDPNGIMNPGNWEVT